MDKIFWKSKKLAEFSEEEWEAICLRCGKCCLFKFERENKIFFSNHICADYDLCTGNCLRYDTRIRPGFCEKVDMKLLMTERELLPETCAYRLLFEGKELPDYHPLVSGNINSPHLARKTVLENPIICSAKDIDDALIDLDRRAYESDWSDEQYKQEEKKVLLRYQAVVIESYEIPSKPKSDE